MLVSLCGLVALIAVVNLGSASGIHEPSAARSTTDRSAHLAIRVNTNPTVEGTLASSTPSFLVLDGPSGLWGVPITRATVFCRGEQGCRAARADLRSGDRIDVQVLNDRGTRVDANSIATDVQIDAVFGDRLVVHGVRHPDQPNPEYTLVLQAGTIMMPRADGSPYAPQVGDRIYYTGRAANADDDSTVYALRIFP
jgi:hypothetical protein